MLYKPDLINKHHELGEKIRLLPKENFFIHTENPQNNISLILQSDPHNKKAFEYLMAWLLLNGNVAEVVNNMGLMKNMDYSGIPRHIEEAALAYADSKGELPDLGGLQISPETQQRFEQYVATYRRINPKTVRGMEEMKNKFGNTFWYYFHFKR